MFVLRHGGRRTAKALISPSSKIRRSYASRISIPFTPPPFPVIESCPSPTCQCREMPSGLDIEREQNLNGSMAAYASQLLISTGKDDWKSRIDEDDDAVLARELRALLGRGGKYSDPYNNVLVTHASFPPTPSSAPSSPDNLPPPPSTSPPSSAYLLPTFDYIPTIPTDPASVEALVRAFLLPTQLHHSHAQATSREQQNHLLRAPQLQKRHFPDVRPVRELLVLICGHGGRDERCGKLGPLLRAEFEEKLHRQGIRVLGEGEEEGEGRGEDGVEGEKRERGSREGEVPAARVGLISHIGGHKFAGNVIIYVPPTFEGNGLRGKGIWYGRVAPEHVEGIVAQTILGGKVIKDMFRGGIDRNGEILRL